ncbi:MAG TPA: hypothetical protein PLQ89_14840 [Phycisphaerae bacterium]|nr:hypothetical protein [Phycisphaerae bacterium]
MSRRSILIVLCISVQAMALSAGDLPMGSAPPPLDVPHMPSRLHAFVWRNWESVNLDRMAEVLGATVEQVAELGASMGLPPHQPVSDDQLARNYIAIIRRNWHLLNYEQLLTLLGWDADRLAHTLKEDDFLWIKLGLLKPACPPLRYAPPDEAAVARAAEIKALVQARFKDEIHQPGEPRFAFARTLSEPLPPASVHVVVPSDGEQPIRFLYAYCALFGDPLMDDAVDPYPEGLLQRLQQVGVNGVWLHVCYRQLAPSTEFPEFGEGWQTRLANLRKLVERGKRYGVKIYLYTNEPRAMPASFYEHRPEMKGVSENDYYAMCTSDPRVRRWLTEAVRHVFREVPGLGGAFTITCSENLTNCWSRGSIKECPRCSKRSAAEVIAEVNQAIAEGVRTGDPNAKTIVWDWAWRDAWSADIIARLPKDVYLMSVSEWDLPITRGGVSTKVGEYSLSAVGPGPRAQRHWELARQAGLKTMAKIQANCTWEISALPYLPVMNLVAEHCAGLAACNVDGMMLSWSLGGYPSPNLELVQAFNRRPVPSVPDALRELATRRYGPAAAPHAVTAWSMFSESFREFPYHGTVVYAGPMQVAPANLLHVKPTGYHSTMVGFPYDDLDNWRAVYPAAVYVGQFRKIADGWKEGLAAFKQVCESAQGDLELQNASQDWVLARAAWCHFASTANQADFIMARNALTEATPAAESQALRARMRELARKEMAIAREMFTLTRMDSRIGYEASNHYYYMPLDMVEKVINCDYVLKQLGDR